jgi:5,10-methylenetetrahydrofolate reductase
MTTCPKAMTYGPCGGVEADGTCELGDRRCVFLDAPIPLWSAESDPAPRTPAATAMLARLDEGGVIVADFPARAVDATSLRACAAILRDHVDAVLAGDAGDARVQFPPSYRARLLRDEGIGVWSGMNDRDRNRVALEGELAALADVAVAGVHCVTGDHTLLGDRPDAKPVFDLDSTATAALARAAGHLVSVGESPAAVPVAARPRRLLSKEHAGAEVCFVNHCGDPERVLDFVAAARTLGSRARFIACVPLVVDTGSAALLRSFTSLVLPTGYLERIERAADPRREGIAASVELARRLLASGEIAGVDLSGGPGAGDELAYAEAMAEVAAELRCP